MEKVIEKHLSVTSTNRGVEKLDHEIYSQDKGTAVFRFTTDELTVSKVLCLFYFKETKRYRTVEAAIEGNAITIPFDSTSIITDESVIGYIYFEKVEQSTDVYAFAFNVWLSAIDKARKTPLIERATGRIVDVEDIVTKKELDVLFAKIKEQGGTYDDSNLRTEIGRISTEIETLKTKTDKDTVYDDSALRERVTALENKTDNDTVYNDTEIKQCLEVLEHKPSVNTSELVTKQELESKGYLTEHQSLEEYAKKTELPQPYNDTVLKMRVQNLETKSDTLATKEELKAVQLRAGERGERGEPGYQIQPSDRERNCFILGLGGVPYGYRSAGSSIGPFYNDKGIQYGTWYLGGVGDGNMLRFQFTDPVPTDRDIGDIRVSNITYITDDPWPAT